MNEQFFSITHLLALCGNSSSSDRRLFAELTGAPPDDQTSFKPKAVTIRPVQKVYSKEILQTAGVGCQPGQ